MTKLIELLEEDDDVQNVWHNWGAGTATTEPFRCFHLHI